MLATEEAKRSTPSGAFHEGPVPMLWARLLADVIVIFHAAYVGFVILGMLAIVVGLILGWSWVRNFWFRIAHLTAIGIVVAEALAGVACPLTTWEKALRVKGGQEAYAGDFLGQWAHHFVFVHAEPWMFTVAYCLFGAAVGLTFIFGPPRWPIRRLAARG